MPIDNIERTRVQTTEPGPNSWANVAADAYVPDTSVARKGATEVAGLKPAGPWCNPELPTMTHEELMQSWGLKPSAKVKPSPMPYDPHKPAPDGFTGNPNPGQKDKKHPNPVIQPCEGEPPVALNFKPSKGTA